MPCLPLGLPEPRGIEGHRSLLCYVMGVFKKCQYFPEKALCFYTYILFTNIFWNVRWEYSYKHVHSGFCCNWTGIQASALPHNPTCDSEGKPRSKHPTGMARIISAWNWVVIVLSSSWYDEVELWNILLSIYSSWWSRSVKHLVGFNPKGLSLFTDQRSLSQLGDKH